MGRMHSRYARQIMLPEIGESGQRRLSAARFAVVGAGGLGSPVLYALAGAGIGHIRIFDADTVDMSNLNRQFMHFETDLGSLKAVSAARKMKLYNSETELFPFALRIDDQNVRERLADVDLVISCVDNSETRLLLNRFCIESGIALIDGGVAGFEGYTLRVLPGVGPCYQCLFPRGNAKPGGVIGASAGVVGSMMAVLAIRHHLELDTGPHLHYIDLQAFRITSIESARKEDCPVCGEKKRALSQ